jgi:hypothetical protein
MHSLCLVFLSVSLGLTAAGCTSADGARRGESAGGTSDMSALVLKARQSGSVKIIVRFTVPGMPENAAVTSGDNDLEERISVAAESVLKGLSGTRYRVYRRYTSLPLIALEASPEAIEALASMPDVADIREDTARPLH